MSQKYHAGDSLALLAIDSDCDTLNWLNWDTQPDPGRWGGVTWSRDSLKRVLALQIHHCHLTGTMDLSPLTYLGSVDCYRNQLSALDVSNTNIGYIDCSNNRLSSLNVNGLAYLDYLICSNNRITELTMNEGLPYLEQVDCSGNLLTEIDISSLPELDGLVCDSNQLTYLDLSSANLTLLQCSANRFTELDVTSQVNLVRLECRGNMLTELDFLYHPRLRHLVCSWNRFSDLDVSALTNLHDLDCSGNLLTDLDVSGLQALEYLDCRYNMMPFSSLARSLHVANLTCNPQDTLFEPRIIPGDTTLDYSTEALIDTSETKFYFYKNGEEDETNYTGIYETGGPGVYYCAMRNPPLFPGLRLVTAPITIIPLGIEEENPDKIGIYPNPVADILNLDIPVSQFQVELFDMYGKKMYENCNVTEIDMPGYPSGVYYVKVCSGDDVWIGRVVKR